MINTWCSPSPGSVPLPGPSIVLHTPSFRQSQNSPSLHSSLLQHSSIPQIHWPTMVSQYTSHPSPPAAAMQSKSLRQSTVPLPGPSVFLHTPSFRQSQNSPSSHMLLQHSIPHSHWPVMVSQYNSHPSMPSFTPNAVLHSESLRQLKHSRLVPV